MINMHVLGGSVPDNYLCLMNTVPDMEFDFVKDQKNYLKKFIQRNLFKKFFQKNLFKRISLKKFIQKIY